jgi:hypothetical protein
MTKTPIYSLWFKWSGDFKGEYQNRKTLCQMTIPSDGKNSHGLWSGHIKIEIKFLMNINYILT